MELNKEALQFFKEKGIKGGSKTSAIYGREHYINIQKKSVATRMLKKLSTPDSK